MRPWAIGHTAIISLGLTPVMTGGCVHLSLGCVIQEMTLA